VESQLRGREKCESENYYYEAIQISVVVSGFYTFFRSIVYNVQGNVYKNYFNPFNITENLISENSHLCQSGWKFFADLESNSTYMLIVTSFDSEMQGSFTFSAYGPSHMDFKRISEYLYFLNKKYFNMALDFSQIEGFFL